MKSFPELRPRWPDAVVAAAVVLLAAACAWLIWRGTEQGGALEAVVSVDGTEAFTTPLTGLTRVERTVQANGYTLKIILTDKEVWVEESDCPTQDCVHTGHISRRGQSIVCLPARVTVRLVGGTGEPDVDAVIG